MKEINMSNAGHSFVLSRLLICTRQISPECIYKALEPVNNSFMMEEERRNIYHPSIVQNFPIGH